MTISNAQSPLQTREILERRANFLRQSLGKRLDALDRRRHEIVRVTHLLGKEVKLLLPVLGVVVGVVAVGGVVVRVANKRRQKRTRRELWVQLLSPPNEALTQPPAPNSVGRTLRNAALGLLLRVASRVAVRAAQHALGSLTQAPPATQRVAEPSLAGAEPSAASPR